MKRFGLTLVAAVCLSASTFAAGNQPTTASWEGNINVSKLSKYLKLSANQQKRLPTFANTLTSRCHVPQTQRKIRKSCYVTLFTVI